MIHTVDFLSVSGKHYGVVVSSRFWYVGIDGPFANSTRTIRNGQVDWDDDENLPADIKTLIEQYVIRLWKLRAFL